ncbi:MAG: Glu/Leu/Phe/Val dehydrogenase [Candidatus Electrothrix sp. MAN1_4]|nr:Glu/Leu/Phe/Val dehydrogenase [Candidatus Electrothrix sp. MAN1_4]
MFTNTSKDSDLIVEYTDPIEGFKGWLVIDSMTHRLAAGGLRVQQGLTCECVQRLAATMTLKMRIARIRADGAKSGIDYDPGSPGKQEALFRFMRAIKPYMEERYSMGPDLNTTMPELDAVCQRLGISSIKNAVARNQQLDDIAFTERTALLAAPCGHATLGRLRSGAGVAASCLATLEFLGISPQKATVAIQGFGGLAAGAAYLLHKAGVQIIGLADREKSLFSINGTPLDIPALLAAQDSGEKGLIPYAENPQSAYGENRKIYDLSCDIFVPAAIEKAVDKEVAEQIQVKAIASGANLAVTEEAEQILHERSIPVIPDIVAGCGGSLSMEGLYGPEHLPTAQEVLAHVDRKTRQIVKTMLERSQQDNISPRAAALLLCKEAPLYPDTRPYGAL